MSFFRVISVNLRAYILLFLLIFGLTPLILAVLINLPLVLDRTALFYQRAYLQNLRADFRDLDQHLASRHELIRFLAKLPEPGLLLGTRDDSDQVDLARAIPPGSTRSWPISTMSSRSCLSMPKGRSASGWCVMRVPRNGVPPLRRPRSRIASSSMLDYRASPAWSW
ncbi:MAG: hypothetical protein ACUVQI_05725 [Thermochromatium sp.]